LINNWFSAPTIDVNNTLRSVPAKWQMFAAAAFLVSIPVFVEAPLVRQAPELATIATIGWIILGYYCRQHPESRRWGDLIWGFSWSWLAGAIYWGWLRWEPLWHLPVESIGLPCALWWLWRGRYRCGALFYLGSLAGTAITDGYCYAADLMAHWRSLFQVAPELSAPILHDAILQMHTLAGISWAIVLVNLAAIVGILGLASKKSHWGAFSGAVMMTAIVDLLFVGLAAFA
jgi:hypothetical protein